MAFGRRRFSSGRRTFGGFQKPMAKKKLLWTNALFTVADLELGASRGTMLSSGQWVLNATAGNLERAKLLKVIFTMSATVPTTSVVQGLQYALYVDDADASSPGDPATTTFWDAVQPFHTGVLTLPASNAGVVTPGTMVNSNFRDNIRSFKVNRNIRTDQALFMSISSGVAGVSSGTLDVSGIARCLLSLD